MAKYVTKTLLWSPSQKRFIQKGEIIEMDENMQTTIVLLKKGAIDVAIHKSIREEPITVPVMATPMAVPKQNDIARQGYQQPFIVKAKKRGKL